jgi:hypothetical protein
VIKNWTLGMLASLGSLGFALVITLAIVLLATVVAFVALKLGSGAQWLRSRATTPPGRHRRVEAQRR